MSILLDEEVLLVRVLGLGLGRVPYPLHEELRAGLVELVLGGAGAERLGIRFEVETGGDFFTAMLSAVVSLLGDLLSRRFGMGLCAVDGPSAPSPTSSTPSTKSLAGKRRISTKDAEMWTREKRVKLKLLCLLCHTHFHLQMD